MHVNLCSKTCFLLLFALFKEDRKETILCENNKTLKLNTQRQQTLHKRLTDNIGAHLKLMTGDVSGFLWGHFKGFPQRYSLIWPKQSREEPWSWIEWDEPTRCHDTPPLKPPQQTKSVGFLWLSSLKTKTIHFEQCFFLLLFFFKIMIHPIIYFLSCYHPFLFIRQE